MGATAAGAHAMILEVDPETYNVKGIPSNWLIDRDGTIRVRGHALDPIEKMIPELLEGGAKPAPGSNGKSGD